MLNLFQIYQCSLVVNIHPLLLESLSLPQVSAFPPEVHGVSYNKEKYEQHIKIVNTILHMFVLVTEQFAFKKSILIHFRLNIQFTANKVC